MYVLYVPFFKHNNAFAVLCYTACYIRTVQPYCTVQMEPLLSYECVDLISSSGPPMGAETGSEERTEEALFRVIFSLRNIGYKKNHQVVGF